MALRRNIRLRKEYLHRKAEEAKELAIYEKKHKIRTAIEAGKPIPTEFRGEKAGANNERRLREAMAYDDEYTFNKPAVDVDDEYTNAGVMDPKICVTTSRNPSSRLKQFAKEMRLMFPNSTRINRGAYKLQQVVETCRENEFTDIIFLHEHRGEPDAMTICHLPHGPTAVFTLYNTVMRHDIFVSREEKKTISEAYPHLIFDNFTSKLGSRVENVLKYLFPVPKTVDATGKETKRVLSFINRDDFISFRHHTFKRKEDSRASFEPGIRKPRDIELEEIGPRFELQLYQIKLGTVDQVEAETEWVRHFYMNTSNKRKTLSLPT